MNVAHPCMWSRIGWGGNTEALADVYAHSRMLGISHLRSSTLRPTLPPLGGIYQHTATYAAIPEKGVSLNSSTPSGCRPCVIDCLPTLEKPPAAYSHPPTLPTV